VIGLPDPFPPSLRPTIVRSPGRSAVPIGSVEALDRIVQRLDDAVLPDDLKSARITVAFTDATRHAPDHLLVGWLLCELEERGARREQITLLAATGLHRPMTLEEIERKVGREIAGSLRVVNHDAFNRNGVHYLGDVAGMPVEAHRLCVECDLLLATGIVEPHQYAGWSGGAKTVVIGCGGERTIAATHAISTLDQPGVRLGAVAGNPFQRFIRQAGALIGVRGVINAVVEESGAVDAVAFGSPNAVHDALIARAARDVLVPVERAAHIAVAGVPQEKAVNLYQASRAATYLALSERPPLLEGAPIILSADIPEGVGEGAGEERFGAALAAAASPRELIDRARRDGLPGGAQRAYMVACVLEHSPLIVVGSGDRALIERCHLHATSTLGEALALAERLVRSNRPLLPATLDLLVVEDAIATIVTAV